MADLKAVYSAVDEQAALNALDTFGERWDKKYPKISQSWRANWANLSTYFKYPQEVRRLIYTTNAIEGFNRCKCQRKSEPGAHEKVSHKRPRKSEPERSRIVEPVC